MVGTGSVAGQPLLELALLFALAMLPFVFLTCTSFAKMSVVFSILRNALGTGQAPSGTVLAALSAMLTLYVMAPVGESMQAAALPRLSTIDLAQPLDETGVDALLDAGLLAADPLRDFLTRHAGARERSLFADLARRGRSAADAAQVTDRDLRVVLPAFLVTELGEALMIGFLVFVPFLVVDMVVANVLLALGMHMLSPTTVSLPFKLLLFVSVDGFYLLSRALVLGYV